MNARTSRWRGRVAWLLVLLTVICAPLLYLEVTRPPGDRGLADSVMVALERRDSIIDFAAIAAFHWTDMYVIGAYSSPQRAEQALGTKWRWRWPYSVYQDENFVLIFADSGRVVATVDGDVARRGWMLERGDESHYRRSSARFSVRRVPGGVFALSHTR
jgi:hypothetical protein